MRNPTAEEKAWMAGFTDGEGCFQISKQIRKGRPSPAFRPIFTVCNTSKDVLQIFVDCYGGALYEIHESRKDKRGVNWADAYTWYCREKQLKKFVNDLLPYLRLKRAHAEIMLEYINNKNGFSRKSNSGVQGGSAPLSDEEITYRESLRLRIRVLNTKGPFSRHQEIN